MGVLLLVVAHSSVEAADAVSGSFLFRSQMSDVEMPLYVGTEAQPAGTVRVGRVFTDYERRGFFRIGALPLLVLDGVTIELVRPEQAQAALAQAQGWLGAGNSQPATVSTNGGTETPARTKTGRANRMLDCRNLMIVIPGSTTNILRAGRARIGPDGQLGLSENVRVEGLLPLQARQARLQMSGPNCGELAWEAQDGTMLTNSLLPDFGIRKASAKAGL